MVPCFCPQKHVFVQSTTKKTAKTCFCRQKHGTIGRHFKPTPPATVILPVWSLLVMASSLTIDRPIPNFHYHPGDEKTKGNPRVKTCVKDQPAPNVEPPPAWRTMIPGVCVGIRRSAKFPRHRIRRATLPQEPQDSFYLLPLPIGEDDYNLRFRCNSQTQSPSSPEIQRHRHTYQEAAQAKPQVDGDLESGDNPKQTDRREQNSDNKQPSLPHAKRAHPPNVLIEQQPIGDDLSSLRAKARPKARHPFADMSKPRTLKIHADFPRQVEFHRFHNRLGYELNDI